MGSFLFPLSGGNLFDDLLHSSLEQSIFLVRNVNAGILERVSCSFKCSCTTESCPAEVALLCGVVVWFLLHKGPNTPHVIAQHTLCCLACVLEFCPWDEAAFVGVCFFHTVLSHCVSLWLESEGLSYASFSFFFVATFLSTSLVKKKN